MRFKVRVSALQYGQVDVEAANEEEAKKIASEKKIDYFDEEITDMTVEPLNENSEYLVTELCPHCNNEIEMRWNTDERGFEAVCPVCGGVLMLCDECRHSGLASCDWQGNPASCRHSKRNTQLWMRLGISLDVSRSEADALLGGDEKLSSETLRKIIEDGRFKPDGDSYIPECVVSEFNNTHGTNYKVSEVSFNI